MRWGICGSLLLLLALGWPQRVGAERHGRPLIRAERMLASGAHLTPAGRRTANALIPALHRDVRRFNRLAHRSPRAVGRHRAVLDALANARIRGTWDYRLARALPVCASYLNRHMRWHGWSETDVAAIIAYRGAVRRGLAHLAEALLLPNTLLTALTEWHPRRRRRPISERQWKELTRARSAVGLAPPTTSAPSRSPLPPTAKARGDGRHTVNTLASPLVLAP